MVKFFTAAKTALLWALTALAFFSWVVSPSAADYAGIDISEFQGDIGFASVRDSGREIVYIKAGESDFEDPKFRGNAAGAAAAGLDYGFYFYVTARTVDDAGTQARYFASLIRGILYTCRPAVDFESFGDLTKNEINDIAAAFAETLRDEVGVLPLFYTDSENAANLWDASLKTYPLWVAAYGVDDPDTGIWRGFAGHQYADDGAVPGITGAVDLDLFKEAVLLSDTERRIIAGEDEPDDVIFDYTVQDGDTLWEIARYFGTTVNELVRLNGIATPDLIFTGEVLKIPKSAGCFYYTVKSGDTLWQIAERYGTTVAEILWLNSGIKDPDLIFAGEVICLPEPDDGVIYTVKAGDTLWEIARMFGTTVENIVRMNGIVNPDLIFAGEILRIT